MEVWFWKSFAKKANSTKVPSAAPTLKVDIPSIRMACSETNPRLYMDKWESYTYCYIPHWGRYYHVVSSVFNGTLTEIQLAVDVLASFRSQILGSTQYVLRSASQKDGAIIDTLYPVEVGATSEIQLSPVWGGATNNPFTADMEKGCYIVGIINPDSADVGAVSYYVMTPSEFRALRKALMTDVAWANDAAMEITAHLLKVFLNPIQYIASCMWFPFSKALVHFAPEAGVMKYGYYFLTSMLNVDTLTSTQVNFSLRWNLQHHPQISRGSYLNANPYTRTRINWPAVGSIPIDSSLISNEDIITCVICIDMVTGLADFTFQGPKENNYVETVTASVGVPIQLSQITIDYAGALTDMASTALSIATAPTTAARIGSGLGIGSAYDKLAPQLRSINTNGSTIKFKQPPMLIQTFMLQTPQDNTRQGSPLCKAVKLSSLTGYTVCDKAVADVAGTLAEKTEIESFLNGGFYIE